MAAALPWAFALCLLVSPLAATELPQAAAAVRTQAEADLAATRERILAEQKTLLAELQAAMTACEAARQRSLQAQAAAQAAETAAERREREQERSGLAARLAADRAAVAARPDADTAQAWSTLPSLAKARAATLVLIRRLADLPDRFRMKVMDTPVAGRDGLIATVPVLHLGEARRVALGPVPATQGLVVKSADGRADLVAGPALPSAIILRDGRPSAIPLDAAGTATVQVTAVQRSFRQWLEAGRFFIWPILLVGLVGLCIAVERAVALYRRRVDPRVLVQVAGHLTAGASSQARQMVADATSPLERVLRAGLDAATRPREQREALVEQALLAETAAFTRGLPAIAVLAGVAPLLGLLGTVTGMIDLFGVLAAQGPSGARTLSGGIAEALICTQAGMLVAVPLLILHAWLGRLADRRSLLLEEAACGILGLAPQETAT